MTMLEQIQKIREELEKMSDEELSAIFNEVTPESAGRFATLERWILKSEEKE